MFVRRSALAFASILAIAGCNAGCNDGAAAPTLQPGVPPSTDVGHLSDAQAQDLCRSYEALANQLVGASTQKQLGCVATGVAVAATGSTSCQSTYDNCMKETTNTGTPIDLPCDAAKGTDFAACNVTIGELESCVNAISADLDPLIHGLDCSVATDSAALQAYMKQIEDTANGSTIAACTALVTACPQYAIDIVNALPKQ